MPFDIAKAQRVKTFIESLKHSQGQWAGEPFKLMDWQWEQVVSPLFGTMKDDATRRYRYCYLEIPKKNGKSPFSAAIGLYMLCADQEASPEVYIAAADREQAGYVFRYAMGNVYRSEVLSKRLKVVESRKRIVNYKNNGFMQVLSSEAFTKHGLNPSCVIFDELHAQPNDELWSTLTSGTDYARRQQIVLALTTAGIWNKESIWWRTREKARQISEGIIEQDNFLPVLYLADPENYDASDEALWIKLNPSLGHIFTLDKIRENYLEVKNNPLEYQNFLRFRLNIPIKHLRRWMPMEDWDKGARTINMEALQGKECYGGLDMSTKIDLAAYVMLFPPQGEQTDYIVLVHFYCPEDTIIQRSLQDAVHYDLWESGGFLTSTPGNVIDEEFIEKDILKSKDLYSIKEIGYDPWGATALANRLFNTHGIKMVEVRQGTKSMSEPAKDILVKTMKGNIQHGGHPILRWNMDNIVMQIDANENIRPDKEKATERIDGGVALINAWNRITNVEDLGPSVYDTGGFLIVG